jgi:hypothetical protein
MRGEPNPRQWEMYEKNNCVFHYEMPHEHQYMRNWNQGYMEWAQSIGIRRDKDPIVIHIYSEFLQGFRRAAQGKRAGKQPPDALRKRVETYFDPLPFYYAPLETQAPTRPSTRSTPLRSAPWPCTTRGTRKMPGCARSIPTTTCSSIPKTARAKVSLMVAGCG